MKMSLFKNKEGFTLVELMVVVAIIGILSAIAVPNFKKFQAKAKQSEAKITLAGIYTVETSALADYSTYASCLSDLGVDPPGKGFYIAGFAGTLAPAAVPTCTSSNLLTPSPHLTANGTAPATVTGSGIAQTVFTAGAAGKISSSNATADNWIMTDAKVLTNNVSGL